MYKGKVVAAPAFVKYDLCETEISVEYSFGLGIQCQGTWKNCIICFNHTSLLILQT
jgi:hypothetical protein